jgi:hypothetical protein
MTPNVGDYFAKFQILHEVGCNRGGTGFLEGQLRILVEVAIDPLERSEIWAKLFHHIPDICALEICCICESYGEYLDLIDSRFNSITAVFTNSESSTCYFHPGWEMGILQMARVFEILQKQIEATKRNIIMSESVIFVGTVVA